MDGDSIGSGVQEDLTGGDGRPGVGFGQAHITTCTAVERNTGGLGAEGSKVGNAEVVELLGVGVHGKGNLVGIGIEAFDVTSACTIKRLHLAY